jgi:hypothetical protein
MNTRRLLIGISVLVCITSVIGTVVQGKQLRWLEAEKTRLISKIENRSAGLSNTDLPTPTTQNANYSPSVELLQLREQVNRLTARKRELENVTDANAQLKAQIAARKSTTPSLPPGFTARATAAMAGYNTPEATIQTFLWAIQSGDVENILRTMTPKAEAEMREAIEKEEKPNFATMMKSVLGLRILEMKPGSDGEMLIKVEMMIHGNPRPDPEQMRLRQIAGQWKIEHL